MSSMPIIKAFADELRAVFGVDEMNAAMKQHGYLAKEGGRCIDTRTLRYTREVSLVDMVVRRSDGASSAAVRGARGR